MDFDISSYEIPLEDLLPRIVVKDPVVHSTWEDGKFTSYLICIKTNHPAFHLPMSAVRRRFSELVWLAKTLKANHHHVSFPTLPPKTVLTERFHTDFIQERMKLIENYLNELLVTDTILSDAAFHLFLQTDLTKEEMEEYFAGRLPEEFVESAWKNIGHVHTSSYVVNINTVPCEPQEIFMNEEDLKQNSRKFSSSGNSFEEIANLSAGLSSDLSAASTSNLQPTASKQTVYAEIVPVSSSTLNERKSEVPVIRNNNREHTNSIDSSDFECSLPTQDSIKLKKSAASN